MSRKGKDITIHSSATAYLTFVASIGEGGNDESVEIRYEDENIWLTQKTGCAL